MATKSEQEQKAGADLVAHHGKAQGPTRIPKIDRIVKTLHNIDLNQVRQPEYQEVFNDHQVDDLVNQVLSIIRAYEKEGIRARLGHLDDDITKLSALLVTLSMHAGAMQGHSFHIEENIKVLSATTYARADAASVEQDIKLTKDDHTAVSRIISKDARERHVASEAANKVITNLYFAAKQFVDILSNIAGRYQRR